MEISASRPLPPEQGSAPAPPSNSHLVIDADKMARLRTLDLIGITSVTILPGVTTIGPNAFFNCTGLTSLVLPAGLTTIGPSAFRGCTGLTSLVLPAGGATIGQSAFRGCAGLISLVLPAGITTIEPDAFFNCTGLTSLVLPAGLTTIGPSAFEDCCGLTSLVLPVTVATIGPYAFRGCTGLTSLALPAGLTTIGQAAFRDCTGLTSLVLPAGLTTIGPYAFFGCTSLTLVYIMCNNEGEFAALEARMRPHVGQAVEFRFISARVIGDIINKLTFHLPGLPIERHVPPANLGAVLEGPGNGPLSLYEPNALQYNNYHAGQPYRPHIRAYIENVLLTANRALANLTLSPLPPEVWWHILSFLFYQRLGPHQFQALMESSRTPGHMRQGRDGPIFAAIEPATGI